MYNHHDIQRTKDMLSLHIPAGHPAWEAINAALTIERCKAEIEVAQRLLECPREAVIDTYNLWASGFEEYHRS